MFVMKNVLTEWATCRKIENATFDWSNLKPKVGRFQQTKDWLQKVSLNLMLQMMKACAIQECAPFVSCEITIVSVTLLWLVKRRRVTILTCICARYFPLWIRIRCRMIGESCHRRTNLNDPNTQCRNSMTLTVKNKIKEAKWGAIDHKRNAFLAAHPLMGWGLLRSTQNGKINAVTNHKCNWLSISWMSHLTGAKHEDRQRFALPLSVARVLCFLCSCFLCLVCFLPGGSKFPCEWCGSEVVDVGFLRDLYE